MDEKPAASEAPSPARSPQAQTHQEAELSLGGRCRALYHTSGLFKGEKTESQRGKVTDPRSHSWDQNPQNTASLVGFAKHLALTLQQS